MLLFRVGVASASLVFALCILSPGCSSAPPPPPVKKVVVSCGLSLGVFAAEVHHDGALIWGRCDCPGFFHVNAQAQTEPAAVSGLGAVKHDNNDQIAIVPLAGLKADTTYDYMAWCDDKAASSPDAKRAARGAFHTTPLRDAELPVRFTFGGDLGGDNICRDRIAGFPVFTALKARKADFFIGMGDMIYADTPCNKKGAFGNEQVPGDFSLDLSLTDYRAKWRYNRADLGWQRFAAFTPYYGIWDDHEVLNDFGPLEDMRMVNGQSDGVHRLPIGREAFIEFTPLWDKKALYRSVRWGKWLEVFILDTRSFRDLSTAPDTKESPKSMLGKQQLAWLLEGIKASDAAWKVLVTGMPLAVGNDGPNTDTWADHGKGNGYETELKQIMTALSERKGQHLWISSDAHLAAAIAYQPIKKKKGFKSFELVAGPLNASIRSLTTLDDTFAPKMLYSHAFAGDKNKMSWADAQTFFHFGEIDIASDKKLTARIYNAKGDMLFEQELPLK